MDDLRCFFPIIILLIVLAGCSKLSETPSIDDLKNVDNNGVSNSDELSENNDIQSFFPNNSSDDFHNTSKSPVNDNNAEKYIFFTDPHLYTPNNSFSFDESWFNNNIPLLKDAYATSSAHFIMCGGDLLNNYDTRSQAIYKITVFVDRFNSSFDKFYILAGNHDTNYQGDTFMNSGDTNSCMLSTDELEESMFRGGLSYYYFDTSTTRNYCFNSCVNWNDNYMDMYLWQQVKWFATDLFANKKEHISLFSHIALNNTNYEQTAFMKNIGSVIRAFNSKNSVEIEGSLFDYSSCVGHIDFIQAGHNHKDINNRFCGGVPIIVTTSFSSPEVATQPTFDYVRVNYDKMIVECTRFGDGESRVFNI